MLVKLIINLSINQSIDGYYEDWIKENRSFTWNKGWTLWIKLLRMMDKEVGNCGAGDEGAAGGGWLAGE